MLHLMLYYYLLFLCLPDVCSGLKFINLKPIIVTSRVLPLFNCKLYRFIFSCFTKKGRPNSPPDVLPASRLTPRVEKVRQSMTEARQTTAVIITFRKPNKNSLERQTGSYRSNRFKMSYILCQRSLIFSEENRTLIFRYLRFGINVQIS